jgi:hypothetical protein
MKLTRWLAVAELSAMLSAASALGCGGREAAWACKAKQATQHLAPQQLAEEKRLAEAAFAKRDDESELRAAISHWETVVATDPKDHETWEQLAHAYYFLADAHLRFRSGRRGTDDMLEAFERGVTAAEQGLMALSAPFAKAMKHGAKIEDAAKTLERDAVPLLYWRATSLGKWATAKGFATMMANKDDIRKTMQVCLEKYPEYFYRGPDRYFGAYYARAPAFAGGDLDESRKHFEASILAFPAYFGTHVLMAEDLAVKLRDRELFEEKLNYVLASDPELLAGAGPENRAEQRKARALLDNEGALFE